MKFSAVCLFLSFNRPVRLESACSSEVNLPEKHSKRNYERKEFRSQTKPADIHSPADHKYHIAVTNNKTTMFKRSFRSNPTSQPAGGSGMDSQYKVDKSARLKSKGTTMANSVRDQSKLSKLQRSLTERETRRHDAVTAKAASSQQEVAAAANLAPSPIVTLTIGREGRLFAAHEDVLCQSAFFKQALRGGYLEASYAQSRRIALPDEEPEIFSAVLEYLYKGDYYPRLLHNKRRNSWELEDSARRGGPATPTTTTTTASPHTQNFGRAATTTGAVGGSTSSVPSSPRHHHHPAAVEATIYVPSAGHHLLRDTVVYCAAERYGLEELKRLALRKQGLQTGIDVGTILRSAQYCYAHTPDSDSRLRAHYLALIIRCRKTFKRSGTMQAEMERGGEGSKLFFDLFVALCNHLDDVIEVGNKGTPRTI